MASMSHDPAIHASDHHPGLPEILKTTQLWAGLSITAMWVAVAFAAVFGSDFVSTSAGGDTTTIPSGVPVALFAFLGTWVVARYGLRSERT
jgi:hypothetical protein